MWGDISFGQVKYVLENFCHTVKAPQSIPAVGSYFALDGVSSLPFPQPAELVGPPTFSSESAGNPIGCLPHPR